MGRQPSRKMYLCLLSDQLMFRNFSASMGTSLTKSMQKSTTKRRRKTALNFCDTRNACSPSTRLPQKRALAGVGRPMKP